MEHLLRPRPYFRQVTNFFSFILIPTFCINYADPHFAKGERQGSERAEMGLLNPLICSSSQLSRQLVPPLYRAGTQGGRYWRSREFYEVMDSVRPAFLGAILDNG